MIPEYKQGRKMNRIFVDQDVVDLVVAEGGVDQLALLREKHPDAEIVSVTGRTPKPFNPYKHLEADSDLPDRNGNVYPNFYKRLQEQFPDEMRFDYTGDYAGAEERMHALLAVEDKPEDVMARMVCLSGPLPHLHWYQEEALRKIRATPTYSMGFHVADKTNLGKSNDATMLDFEVSLLGREPLKINPMFYVDSLPQLSKKQQFNVALRDDAAFAQDLPFGVTIRYKFLREDGKTHKQICKDILSRMKKRRKAAAKQLDYIGAQYDRDVEDNKNDNASD